MTHMTEKELIAYRDGETQERQRFAGHLNECEVCRHEMERIEAVFTALDAMPVADPGEDFSRRVWQNISPRLPEKRLSWWQTVFVPRRLVAFGAMAAIVLLAFFLGRFTKKAEPGGGEIADSGKVRERVLVVAVGDHLGRSEMVLMNLRMLSRKRAKNSSTSPRNRNAPKTCWKKTACIARRRSATATL
jgi:hypothetical protein